MSHKLDFVPENGPFGSENIGRVPETIEEN